MKYYVKLPHNYHAINRFLKKVEEKSHKRKIDLLGESYEFMGLDNLILVRYV